MLSYKKEIIYPLLAASILMTIVLLSLFYSMYNLNEITKRKDFIDTQRFNIITLRNAILDAETSQRGYLIANNVTFLEHYNDSKLLATKTLGEISAGTESLADLKPMLSNIYELCEKKFSIIEASINIQMNAGSYASHLTLSRDHGKEVMDSIRKELQTAESYLMERRQALSKKMQQTMTITIGAGIALVLIIFGILILSYQRTLKLFKEILSSSTKVSDLNYQATHDALTKLLNRRGFESTLENIHQTAMNEKRKYAIFYMDLDGFKAVNDHYSHDTGDALLIAVSRIFQSFLRESDSLARLGGDEFTLIVQSFKDQAELTALAERLINSLKTPITVENKLITVGVSIGIAIYRVNGFHPDQLMAAADVAMYNAKKAGKNRASFVS